MNRGEIWGMPRQHLCRCICHLYGYFDMILGRDKRKCVMCWWKGLVPRNDADCLSEICHKRKSRKTSLPIASLLFDESFWNFAQRMNVMLPCSMQNLRRIRQINGKRDFARFMGLSMHVFPQSHVVSDLEIFTMGAGRVVNKWWTYHYGFHHKSEKPPWYICMYVWTGWPLRMCFIWWKHLWWMNFMTLRSRQNGRHFTGDSSPLYWQKCCYFDSSFTEVCSQAPIW